MASASSRKLEEFVKTTPLILIAILLSEILATRATAADAPKARTVDAVGRQQAIEPGNGILRSLPPNQRVPDANFAAAAKHRNEIEAWEKAIQKTKSVPVMPRIRFKERSIAGKKSESEWNAGRLVEVDHDTLVIGIGLSRHHVYRVPLSSLTRLELNVGRRRNTTRGLMFGVIAGSALAAGMWEEIHDPAYDDPDVSFARAVRFALLSSVVLASSIAGSIIGYNIKTDTWLNVPIEDIALIAAPTQNRGMGAALSFRF